MPGFDKSRVVGLNDQELDEYTCSICLDIFIDPVVTQCCRQTYCKDCIKEWVSEYETCPNDRADLTEAELRPVPLVMINWLDNIKIKCDYEMEGCLQVVRMEDLSRHLTDCDYRPNQLCKTCGLMREFVSTHNCIQSLITEKDKTDVKYLNLFEENSQILLENHEKEDIISRLRNDLVELKNTQQILVDGLRSEHSIAVDLLKNSYDKTSKMERQNYQNELDNLVKTYDNKVSDLESKVSDIKSKLLLSEDNCQHLRLSKQALKEELNSTVDKLMAEHLTFVHQLKGGYASSCENERKNHENELDILRQTYSKQENRLISDLEYELSNCKSKLLLYENKCQTLITSNEEPKGESSSINILLSDHLKAMDKLKAMKDGELESQRESHQIEVDNLRERLLNGEMSISQLTNQLYNCNRIVRQNCRTLEMTTSWLRKEIHKSKTHSSLFVKIVMFATIYFMAFAHGTLNCQACNCKKCWLF